MDRKIVVVGSCMVDFVSYAPRLPREGETIHGTKFCTNFGGKGANQCVAAAKLGAQTSLIARVGDDLWADKYIENLKTCSINTNHVKKTPGFSTGIAQINVADGGANQIVIIAGSNLQLNLNDVNNAENDIREAAVLVCQLETSVEVAIRAMKICTGISILNGAPALSKFDENLLKLPTIFCVNENEAEIFSGVPVKNVGDAEKAILILINKGCNSVIITLGAEGAVYKAKNEDTFQHVKSPKTICKDSTGAGDCFIGALAFMLKNQSDIIKCIEVACFIAADSVLKDGTQISFPDVNILNKIPV